MISFSYNCLHFLFKRGEIWKNQIGSYIHRHQKINHLVTVIFANFTFFFVINNIANQLVCRVNSGPKILSDNDRKFNLIIIRGIVVGGSVFLLNTFLSYAVYPIKSFVQLVVMIGFVFLHTLVEKKPIIPLFSAASSQPISAIPTPQNKFIDSFCTEISKVASNDKSEQDLIYNNLRKGIIEDSSLCASIRKGLNKFLLSQIKDDKINNVIVMILTNSPKEKIKNCHDLKENSCKILIMYNSRKPLSDKDLSKVDVVSQSAKPIPKAFLGFYYRFVVDQKDTYHFVSHEVEKNDQSKIWFGLNNTAAQIEGEKMWNLFKSEHNSENIDNHI